MRKATLASLLSRASPGLRFNERMAEEDGPLVFRHACNLGLEPPLWRVSRPILHKSPMCGRVIQSNGPLRYAIVDGLKVPAGERDAERRSFFRPRPGRD